jgi:hypothetical protein
MAIKSGQMGSFEMKDMAKWFLSNWRLMAFGMKGLSDFAVCLA